MKRLVCFGLFVSACDPSGTANDAGDDRGTDDGASTGAATSMQTASADGTITSGASVDDTAGTSADDTDDPLATELADCADLLAAEPGTPDGLYEFYPGGLPTEVPFVAYCDMTTDGGGWTLVGRSVAPEEATPWDVEFGWASITGSPEVDSAPYSLGALQARLDFAELLIGSHDGAKTWGADAFKLSVPDLFVFVYGTSAFLTVPTTVVGECIVEGGPHHLRGAGWTDDVGRFRILEYEFDGTPGLTTSGFQFYHGEDDCGGSGNLDFRQGMIMVR